MSVTKKPAIKAPTSTERVHRPTASPTKKNSGPGQEFLMAALNMSWQLAIVVLVPILGGFKLDQYFESLPLWTALGFVVAMAGMALVVWRQLQMFTPKIPNGNGGKK